MRPETTVRKAVIPAAGLGTRLFPASHAVKKELFPIVGRDGIARALFHYHLIELLQAGIEQVCLIVQPGDEVLFARYLEGPTDEYVARLAKHPALSAEVLSMRELAKAVTYVVQHTQEGYGHAVFQSRDFSDKEPVLLCLGDHLFQGDSVSPYAELAQTYALTGGRTLSAVNRIGPSELKGYGTIAGRRRANERRIIDVDLIVEKPSVEIARDRLHVDGLPDDTYLGWFGMHVLAPGIYDVLAHMIAQDIRDGGEFQLTRAQDIQRASEGYCALEMTGARRFDFGTPAEYVESLAVFSGVMTS